MRLMLDSHSRIACPAESMFVTPVAKLWGDELAIKGLAGMGFSREHVRCRLKEFVTYYFETYAHARKKARWADKCPHYVDCADFLETLYGPDCLYVFMYRHGLDVACSVANMPIGPAEPYKVKCANAYVGGARYWAVQCAKLLAFQTRVGERGLSVYYEDLVTAPESIARAVLRHVGEPWEDGVLHFYNVRRSRAPGLEDPTASHSRGFCPSLGKWRTLDRSVVCRMTLEALPMLQRLGYSADDPLHTPVAGGRQLSRFPLNRCVD